MKNCLIFLGLVLLSGCANLQWFDELKSGDTYSSGTRAYHSTDSYAYDAPVAATNYDHIDNAQFLLLQKPRVKGSAKLADAGMPPVIRIYKQGLHWTDKKGGFYTRKEGQLKDGDGMLYNENESVWTPVQ